MVMTIDVQKLFDEMASMDRKTRGKYHLNLSQLIAVLQAAKPFALVRFDDGRYPGNLDSYRGYYADLAIDWSEEPKTVAALLEQCRAALDKTFEGYKGGDFVMDADTPLWAAAYGTTAGALAIIGTQDHGDTLVLATKDVD